MQPLQHILELLKARRGPKPLSVGKPLARPYRDWALVIMASSIALMLLSSMALGAYFWVALGFEQGGNAAVITEQSLNIEKMKKTLAIFDAHHDEHKALLSQPPASIDPAK